MNPFRRVWVPGAAGPAGGERVPPQDLPIERKLKYLLDRRWLDAGEAPPKLDPQAYRTLAWWAWHSVDLTRNDDPELLARAHGVNPRARAVRGCYGECTDGLVIAHRVSGEPGMAGLRALHGLAHCFLKMWNFPHTETDVWFLTIALAVTSRRLCELGPERYAAEESPHVPSWLPLICHTWLQTHLGKKLLAQATGLVLRVARIERRLNPPDRVYRVRLAALEARGPVLGHLGGEPPRR